MHVERSVVMQEYSQESSWAVDHVRFECLRGSYRGRGRLSWNPGRGFHLDAYLARSGAVLPSTIEFGKIRVSTESDLHAIRMNLEEWGCAISPQVSLGDHLELAARGRLDIVFPSILFYRALPHRTDPDKHYGSALFEVGKNVMFPDPLVNEVRLAERVIEQNHTRGGIAYNDDSLEISGHFVSENQVRLHWALNSSGWSRNDAWNYAEGAQAALSFLSGRTVRLLERTTKRGAREFIERRREPELVQLGILSLPPRSARGPYQIDKRAFVELARFFTQGRRSTPVVVCRQILAQMAEASQQNTRAGQELLCANILDAALRTLIAGKPYDIKDGKTKIKANMNVFRQKYFSSKEWKRQCDRALDAYNKLRHRHAHPDWLTTTGGGLSDGGLEQSLDHMIFLAWFYGYMILSIAGFKELEPKFPGPHREWPALLTFTTGVSQ